jgi:hypothetical protein
MASWKKMNGQEWADRNGRISKADEAAGVRFQHHK